MKTACLAVDSRHSEILGYGRASAVGRALWDELDWSAWWVDGPGAHMFNRGGGLYLHVRVRFNPKQDGPKPPRNLDSLRWYRVRCIYAGRSYRGRQVESVSLRWVHGQLHWLVGTKGKESAK